MAAVVAGFVGLRDQMLAEEAGPGVSVQDTGHLPLRNLL